MKSTIRIALVCMTLILGLAYYKRSVKRSRGTVYRVGILQTASHPALDAVKDGFVKELTAQLGDKVEVVLKNAQGSVITAQAFAKQLIADNDIQAFLAIATPAAQALGSVQKDKPLIIAAVTDPYALGLMRPQGNVCGVTDLIDIPGQIDMVTMLVPTAKTVGLLYTSGEVNATAMAKLMRETLLAKGLSPIDFTFSSEADIPVVASLAARKTDVILTPTDNNVASAISLIAGIASKNKKPLMVSDTMLLSFGPLAARGVDYAQSGTRAARLALELLLGRKKAYELPLEQGERSEIFVNQKTMNDLGITLSREAQDLVIVVPSVEKSAQS